jgi:glycosyltransferase involved in cell wall biosynthesis
LNSPDEFLDTDQQAYTSSQIGTTVRVNQFETNTFALAFSDRTGEHPHWMKTEMKRRILQTCFSESWGGLEMVALELAERLSAQGIFIKTACTPDSPLAKRLHDLKLPTLSVHRKNKYLSPSVVRTLRGELLKHSYSAVLVEQLNELWQVVPALRGLKHLQLVGISHTLVGVSKKDLFHRCLYSRVNQLVALTSIHKRNLVERLPITEQKVEIIPNAVDLERFYPGRRSEEFRSLYMQVPSRPLIGVVSRIDKGKGLREAIAAARRLRVDGIEFEMLIIGRETIGEEGMKAVLESDIRAMKLEDVVKLTGHRSDIETVMASLDILLMPAPGETFGRVLIEAMASGPAVIAASGGGVADIVLDSVNGLLVPPMDDQAMAEALRRLILEPGLRPRLASGGLKVVKEKYDRQIVDRRLQESLFPN